MEEWELSCGYENVKLYNLFRKEVVSYLKIIWAPPYDSVIPPYVFTQDKKKYIFTYKDLYRNINSSFIYNSPNLEISPIPSTEK